MYETILFDLEGVVFDATNTWLCAGFQEIYNFAIRNNMAMGLVTGATEIELVNIESSISLKTLFGDNIYFTEKLWFSSKKDTALRKLIASQMSLNPEKTLLLDDGENGILWAKSIWISTYYINNNGTTCTYADKTWTLSDCFNFLLSTTNDNA